MGNSGVTEVLRNSGNHLLSPHQQSHDFVGGLIRHLPEFMREFDEFSRIMDTGASELDIVQKATRRVLDNAFLAYADDSSNGLSRWERIFGIISNPQQSFDDRRHEILFRVASHLPYTETSIRSVLAKWLGIDVFMSFDVNVRDFLVELWLQPSLMARVDEIEAFVRHRIPANMELVIHYDFKRHHELSSYRHRELSALTHLEIQRRE